MLVPPESIRNITQVFYERIPNIRSKGTMAKQVGQNEQMLEVTLYFYEDAGINGIKYNYTTPSGEVLTYHMNGLRSLLAQFKVTPFLPIENGYINDVLGIEAVSMQNINIQTVEGFPRLLRVVLTLREFNYRTFMPDLPVDDEDDDTSKLSQLTPMFAKCFNWDIFRYYYQRSIMAGEELKNYEFASYDYNLQFYTNKNTLQRFDFCSPPGMGSKISFYVPDEVWLQNALQVKKQRESSLYTDTSFVDLSDNAKKFCAGLSSLYSRIKKVYNVKDASNFRNKVSNIFKYGDLVRIDIPRFQAFNTEDDITPSGKKTSIKRKGISEPNGDNTMMYIDKDKNNNYISPVTKHELNNLIVEMKNAFLDEINDTQYMTGMTINETVSWNGKSKAYELAWDFTISLNTTSLTDNDLNEIKEALVKSLNDDRVTMDEVFKDNKIRIRFKSLFEVPEGTELPNGNANLGNVRCRLITGSNGLDDTNTDSLSLDTDDFDYLALSQTEKVISEEDEETGETIANPTENAHNEAIDFYIKDYKNPANMPFVPYLENVPISSIAGNMSNTFTDISLKAVEGVGPQFLGGQDTTIELQLMTDDIVVVSMLNNLPNVASATAKKYRRIIPA